MIQDFCVTSYSNVCHRPEVSSRVWAKNILSLRNNTSLKTIMPMLGQRPEQVFTSEFILNKIVPDIDWYKTGVINRQKSSSYLSHPKENIFLWFQIKHFFSRINKKASLRRKNGYTTLVFPPTLLFHRVWVSNWSIIFYFYQLHIWKHVKTFYR